MLTVKIEWNENKTACIANTERKSFPLPNYVEKDSTIIQQVYYLVDAATLLKYKDAENEKDEAVKAENAAAREAIKAVMVKEVPENINRRLAYSIAIGLGWTKPEAVPAEFVELFNMARDYAVDYKSVADWTEERTKRFTAIRNKITDVFESITGDSMKECYKLKPSSKAVNGFLDSLYYQKTITKNLVSGSTWKKANVNEAFKQFMVTINNITGVSHPEKKTTTIKVF